MVLTFQILYFQLKNKAILIFRNILKREVFNNLILYQYLKSFESVCHRVLVKINLLINY